jgi:uncharacterized membrane protein YbhN (UPF0104 family)
VGIAIGVGLAAGLILVSITFAFGKTRSAFRARWAQIKPSLRAVFERSRWRENTALLLYYLCIGLLHGVALKCLVLALIGSHDVSTMSLVVANAAAWLVGFFAIFAPGGLVVREAALATALTAWFTPAESVSIAVSWRIMQIIVELVLLTCVLRCMPGRSMKAQSV